MQAKDKMHHLITAVRRSTSCRVWQKLPDFYYIMDEFWITPEPFSGICARELNRNPYREYSLILFRYFSVVKRRSLSFIKTLVIAYAR
jgi:hypothetical protein